MASPFTAVIEVSFDEQRVAATNAIKPSRFIDILFV
jgi:hypothetical protein